MRIAFLLDGWPPTARANGVVSAMGELLDPLKAHAIEPIILAWNGSNDAGLENVHILSNWRSSAHGQRLQDRMQWSVDSTRAVAQIAPRVIASKLRELQRVSPIDLIEIEESWGWAAELRRKTTLPVVVALHGPWFLHGPLGGESSANPSYRQRVRCEGRGIRRADFLLAPSHDVLERSTRYYRLSSNRNAVLPYALRPRPERLQWNLSVCDPNLILFIGRFDLHKGGDIAIDAFAHVARNRPQAKLVFVGPDRGIRDQAGTTWTLRSYAESRLGADLMAQSVRLTGQLPVNALDELRRQALITISCSRWENLSLAVLEAMACGCPVVVGDSGGLPEHVKHGETGLVFRSRDSQNLADRILTLMGDNGLARRLGRAAVEHVDSVLSPERLVKQRAKLYADVIASSSTRANS